MTFADFIVLLQWLKAKTMKRILFIFLVLSILLGCHEGSLKQHLVEIDSIAFKEGDLKAHKLLNAIEPEMLISNEEDLAYYWLLKIRTEIRLQKEIKTIEPLEIPISYYKKHHDISKLARAYYYKGYVLNQNNELLEAVTSLKEAEALVKDKSSEIVLTEYVYSTLSHANYKGKEKRLAIEYGKKALKAAYAINRSYNIANVLMMLYVVYNDGEHIDSAQYYLNKCVPLVETLPENERYIFYANIGNALVDTNIENAEDYLEKSVALKPNVFAYKGLASVYYKRGEKAKALEMWQTDNLYLKGEILQALYNSQREEGAYKEASETAMQIAELKDSIAQKEKEEDIRGLQEQFEQDQKRESERHLFYVVVSAICVFLLIAIATSGYLLYRNTKGKKKLAETIQHLEGYRQQLKVLEQEGKSDSKEVERLHQKIAELQVKQGALLQNGKDRYEEIEQRGTTLRWSRSDFDDCIEYYRTVDPSFVTHMEQDFRHLSSKYIFFALMEHLGKTDEELQHMMAISQNTIRSYRSRINKAQITT